MQVSPNRQMPGHIRHAAGFTNGTIKSNMKAFHCKKHKEKRGEYRKMQNTDLSGCKKY
jgi:hypothetical protein